MKLGKYIDHTILKNTASKNDIEKLCKEAIEYEFASVCINPSWVRYASELLKDSDVMVCTVIGFPLGANTTTVKAFETSQAILDGADEIDMVINIGKLKDGDVDYTIDDIKAVVEAAKGKTVKVIIETCDLTNEEKILACECATKANAKFVKTSTGFSSGGATIQDVKLMKMHISETMEVKASGGVKNINDCIAMITAGASRIGTSNGILIIEGENAKEGY